MYKVNIIDKISFLLVIIGGLNWGLIGIFDLNLVRKLIHIPTDLIGINGGTFERIVYILVFASAINLILLLIKSKLILNKRSVNFTDKI